MSRTISPVSGKSYGLALVCRIWRVPRATVYRHRAPPLAAVPQRPGPVGPMADAALLEQIRAVLAASHRKVWARLRIAGIRTSRAAPRIAISFRYLPARARLSRHRKLTRLPHPQKVLLQGADETFGTAVAFRGAHVHLRARAPVPSMPGRYSVLTAVSYNATAMLPTRA